MKKSILLMLIFLLVVVFQTTLMSQTINKVTTELMPQSSNKVTTDVGATILIPLTLTKITDLSFVTMPISTTPVNVMPATSNISLLSKVPIYEKAIYMVNGSANAVYTVTLPEDGTVTIKNGTHSIHVNNFTYSHVELTGTLDGSGTGYFTVGASFELDKAQPFEVYTAVFDVIVAYY